MRSVSHGDVEAPSPAPPPIESSNQPFAIGNPLRSSPRVASLDGGGSGRGSVSPNAPIRVTAARQAAAQQLALVSGGSDAATFLSNPLHDRPLPASSRGPAARPSVALPPVSPGLRQTASSKRIASSGDLQHEPRLSSPLALSARRIPGTPRTSSTHAGDSDNAKPPFSGVSPATGAAAPSDEFLTWANSPLAERRRGASSRLSSDVITLGLPAEESSLP